MRFDGTAPNGAATHIVLHQGRAHSWAEGSSSGARYPKDGESYLVADNREDLEAALTGCVRYTGPGSIFDLPGDVAFADVVS